MFENPYYHRIIKKTIIGFGSLFSDLKVLRHDNNNVVAEIVKVPIAFGPKEKFIQRVDGDPGLTGNVYTTLPRLAFEIDGYSYDSERKTNRNSKIQCVKDGVRTSIWSGVPYNLDITLSLLSKGVEDGLAVVEQILPMFTPEYNMSINVIPEMNLILDIPLSLNGVTVDDDYEGDFNTRRLVIHTFNFTAKMMLFSGIDGSNKIIKETNVHVPNMGIEHISQGNDDFEITLDEWRNMEEGQ